MLTRIAFFVIVAIAAYSVLGSAALMAGTDAVNKRADVIAEQLGE